MSELWRGRSRSCEAAGLIIIAITMLALRPFPQWRGRLGLDDMQARDDPATAKILANHVGRACLRLPFTPKCLPRAMALSWMLRRRGIGHTLVLAARPAAARTGTDDLHAWVETQNAIIMGQLPGPWAQLLRLGGAAEN